MHRYMNCMLRLFTRATMHNIYISKALVPCTVYGLGLEVDINIIMSKQC